MRHSQKKQNSSSRVLAVSSGGGHWVQLLRLREAFDSCDCSYISVDREYENAVAPARFYHVPDANKETKLKLLFSSLKIFLIVLWERPDFVISTGAAHGYLAIRFSKLVGAKTMFIDSIANAEKLSLSGELASSHVDLMLTQWSDLADGRLVQYRGSVL